MSRGAAQFIREELDGRGWGFFYRSGELAQVYPALVVVYLGANMAGGGLDREDLYVFRAADLVTGFREMAGLDTQGDYAVAASGIEWHGRMG